MSDIDARVKRLEDQQRDQGDVLKEQGGLLNTLTLQSNRILTLLEERYDPAAEQTRKNTSTLFEPPAGLAIITPAINARLDRFDRELQKRAREEAETTRAKIDSKTRILIAVIALIVPLVTLIVNALLGA